MAAASNRITTARSYDEFIAEDWDALTFRVRRSALRDESVFQLERERIWNRVWLYCGHETEIPHAGDFKVRTVGGRTLILLRDTEGVVRVFYNTCPHRGNTLCRAESAGNARYFRCFYHAWTFNTQGELTGLPGEDGYPESSFRDHYTLRRPPQVASLHGFVWISYSADIEPLSAYLAGAAEHLEMFTWSGPSGVCVTPGTQEYTVRSNWKMAVENALDAYHFQPTHAILVDDMREAGIAVTDDDGWVDALGNGHVVLMQSGHGAKFGLKAMPHHGQAERDQIARNRAALAERVGEARAARYADYSSILFVFPNLLLFDFGGVRLLEPRSAAITDVTAWDLLPIGESEEITAMRIQQIGSFIGPGGLGSADDIEAYEGVQRGIMNTAGDPRPGVDWNDISRGMARELAGERGRSIDESGIRDFYRRWATLVVGNDSDAT